MFFCFNGTMEQLEEKLITNGVGAEIDQWIKLFSIASTLNLNEDEYVKISDDDSLDNPDMMGLFIEEKNVNINLRAATIPLIAVLYNLMIKDWANAGFEATNLFTAFSKISEENGEKCVTIESLQSKRGTVNKKVNLSANGECINNHLGDCRFNQDGQCTLTTNDLSDVLDSLVAKNVFRPIDGENYKYNSLIK